MLRRAICIVLVVSAGWACGRSSAGEPPPDTDHTMARAGYPQEVSRLAHPSDTGSYVGYQVGGGSPFVKSYGPAPDAGTWGWDYQGYCLARNVVLRWWRKPHYQGGSGAYKTDGPRLEREGKEKE
jgi:hypothetical protein